MKRLFLFLLLIPFFTISQNRTLTYQQTNDVEFAKQFKLNILGFSDDTEFRSYITKDNFKIKVGDTLTIGNAIIDRIGGQYASGDLFTNIFMGNMKGKDIKRYDQLEYDHSGKKVIIHAIYVRHKKYTGYKFWKNRKETTLHVSVFVKTAEDGSMLSSILTQIERMTILDLEIAFETGEILNPNPSLTRSEAIQKLKESQDLMELGLLSEEEYNKLREDLIPIINGN